jgi:hypothetical protein
MQGLGLKHVVPAPGETVRFSILPFKVAAISDPCRAILPVVRYLNANSATGKYVKLPNGSFPSIDSEIGYVCLTRRDIVEIRRLPNENQKPYDIDLTMTHAGDRGFGYELACASSQARWILNPETARVVQQKAIEMSAALVAKLTDRPGITLFDDLEATESVARKAKQ